MLWLEIGTSGLQVPRAVLPKASQSIVLSFCISLPRARSASCFCFQLHIPVRQHHAWPYGPVQQPEPVGLCICHPDQSGHKRQTQAIGFPISRDKVLPGQWAQGRRDGNENGKTGRDLHVKSAHQVRSVLLVLHCTDGSRIRAPNA